jgi:hypothetical protein
MLTRVQHCELVEHFSLAVLTKLLGPMSQYNHPPFLFRNQGFTHTKLDRLL